MDENFLKNFHQETIRTNNGNFAENLEKIREIWKKLWIILDKLEDIVEKLQKIFNKMFEINWGKSANYSEIFEKN